MLIKVGNVSAKTGERAFGAITVGEMADGTRVDIPVVIVSGEREGPTLLMVSTMHGIEDMGIEVIRRIVREEVEPKNLRGQLIAIPVANPLAFRLNTYATPQPMEIFNSNLATLFPGDPKGYITQRIAYAIFDQAVSKADYILDYHGNASCALPFVYYQKLGDVQLEKKTEEMAHVIGLTMTYTKREVTNTLHTTSRIPTVTIEQQGGVRMISESSVEVGVRGGLNVMKWLEMIPGEREEQRGITIIKEPLEYYGHLCANHGGILHPEVKAGEKVQKGAIIARIFNLYGEVVEAVKMPVDGYLAHFGMVGKWSAGVSTGQEITEIFQVRK